MSLLDDIKNFIFGNKETETAQAQSSGGTSSQSATTQQTGTASKSANESQQTSGQQSQQTSQAVDTTQAATESGSTAVTGTTTGLSSDVVSALESMITGASTGGVNALGGISESLQTQASKVDENTQRILDLLRTESLNELQNSVMPQIAKLGQATGASGSTNTLVNQLGSGAINDLLAKLAGVEAGVLQGAETQKTQALTAAAGVESQSLQNLQGLTNALKGAVTTTEQTQATDTTKQLTSAQDTTGLVTQLSELVKNTSSEEVTLDTLQKQLNALTDTTGTNSLTGSSNQNTSLLDWLSVLGSFDT